MKTKVGSNVHPWYKGVHEWRVRGIAGLKQPIKYNDPVQGTVNYDPKIMLLESDEAGKVLWFPYWTSTSGGEGTWMWGQRPPMLEEKVLFQLMKDAIKKGLFSKAFLKKVDSSIQLALE